jgi:hypothetical protein
LARLFRSASDDPLQAGHIGISGKNRAPDQDFNNDTMQKVVAQKKKKAPPPAEPSIAAVKLLPDISGRRTTTTE